MLPYTYINPEIKFLAGQMSYQWLLEDKSFSGKDSIIVYETWFGRIYEIAVYFEHKDYESILAKLREKYKAWDETAFSRVGDYSHWEFGEYEIALDQYADYPKAQLLYRYWPLAKMAKMAEEDYRRRNEAASDLGEKAPDAPEPSR